MAQPVTGAGHSWWSVQFYQENDGINFGSAATIDDLLNADCTIEAYVKRRVAGAIAYILTKNGGGSADGWRWYLDAATGKLGLVAFFATDNIAVVSTSPLTVDRWYHAAIDWEVATLTARLFLNGAFQGSDTATGAYLSDAARNMICNGVVAVGTVDSFLQIGPIRISNTRRYVGAGPFTVPQPPNWPTNDANDLLITRMNDGAGVTATDYSGNGNNGTITFGATTRWYNDPNIRL